MTDANPLNAPRIDPAFLSDPRDLTTSMAAARLMQRVPVAEPLAPWRGQRLYPHDGIDTAWKADFRARADTIYHPAGTCRKGRDAMAVTAPICASTGCRVCVWLTPA